MKVRVIHPKCITTAISRIAKIDKLHQAKVVHGWPDTGQKIEGHYLGQNCWITKFLTWPHFLASSSSYTYLVTSAHLKDNFIYYTNNKFLARSFSVHGPTCIIELKKILSYQTMSIVLIFISEYTCIIDKEEPFHFMLLLEHSWIFFFEFCPFWSDFLLKQGPNYKLVYITKIISESYVIDGWFISCSHNVTSHDSREIHY